MATLSHPTSSLLLQNSENIRNSPNKSPRRLHTDPNYIASNDDLILRVYKRIIVCCDGTWQDGVSEQRSAYTNILRLARTINHADERLSPAIPQIVFYQSGIGSEKNFYSEYIEGTTGSSLADKVEDAYAFIAHNYNPGDEIFLFGFSRGAYTARMVAMFIGEIGVLDRKDMDHFAGIFIAYQKLGKSKKPEEKERLKEQLAPWSSTQSPGKMRVGCNQGSFTVRCVGVFDTVGSLGLPEELTLRAPKLTNLFGFPDRILGEHVERAYHAMALNETRTDFNVNKFQQTEAGRQKNQILKQARCHSDIGGGYKEHDLADISLTWMLAHIGDILSLDVKYLSQLPQPVGSWGTQKPHDPATGIFSLAHTIQRSLPTFTDNITEETIHLSVLKQASVYPALSELLKSNPSLISPLLPLEEEMKETWPFRPESSVVQSYALGLGNQIEIKKERTSVRQELFRTGSRMGKSVFRTLSLSVSKKTTSRVITEAGAVTYEERNWKGGVELTDNAKANGLGSTN